MVGGKPVWVTVHNPLRWLIQGGEGEDGRGGWGHKAPERAKLRVTKFLWASKPITDQTSMGFAMARAYSSLS